MSILTLPPQGWMNDPLVNKIIKRSETSQLSNTNLKIIATPSNIMSTIADRITLNAKKLRCRKHS